MPHSRSFEANVYDESRLRITGSAIGEVQKLAYGNPPFAIDLVRTILHEEISIENTDKIDQKPGSILPRGVFPVSLANVCKPEIGEFELNSSFGNDYYGFLFLPENIDEYDYTGNPHKDLAPILGSELHGNVVTDLCGMHPTRLTLFPSGLVQVESIFEVNKDDDPTVVVLKSLIKSNIENPTGLFEETYRSFK